MDEDTALKAAGVNSPPEFDSLRFRCICLPNRSGMYMDTTQTGTIAEMQAALAYMKDGWEVFFQSNGKAPFDLVAYKDETLRRVTVKGTTQKSRNAGGYVVDLRSIRPNRSGNTIKQLREYDELFVWIFPWEEGFFFTPQDVNGRQVITFNSDRRMMTGRGHPQAS